MGSVRPSSKFLTLKEALSFQCQRTDSLWVPCPLIHSSTCTCHSISSSRINDSQDIVNWKEPNDWTGRKCHSIGSNCFELLMDTSFHKSLEALEMVWCRSSFCLCVAFISWIKKLTWPFDRAEKTELNAGKKGRVRNAVDLPPETDAG